MTLPASTRPALRLPALPRLVLWFCLCLGAEAPLAAGSPPLTPVPLPNLEQTDETVNLSLRKARQELESVLAGGPDAAAAADAYGETGMLYHAHLVFEPARVCYENAARLVPSDPRWPYYLGYLHQQNGRLEPAVAAYEAALALDPGLDNARMRLAQGYLELGRLEQAEALFAALAPETGYRGAALFGLGRLAFARQDFAEARAWLDQALEASPGALKVHYTLAQVYRALHQPAKAREHLRRLGTQEPGFPDPLRDELDKLSIGHRTLFHYALNAVHRREYADAVRMFAEGLAMDQDNVDARVSLARALYLNGDPEAAEGQLNEVLRRDETHALAAFLRGALAEERGREERAASHYRQALLSDPGHPGAHYRLANHLMRTGEFAQAAAHYAAALEREPDNAPAALREVLALIAAGSADSIIRGKLERAYSQYPGDGEFPFLLGVLLAASPDPAVRDGTAAVALAERLYESGATPESMELLAMAYAESGDFAQAIARQEDALALAPAFAGPDQVARLGANLERYREGRPCREPWAGKPPPPPAADALMVMRSYPTDAPY